MGSQQINSNSERRTSVAATSNLLTLRATGADRQPNLLNRWTQHALDAANLLNPSKLRHRTQLPCRCEPPAPRRQGDNPGGHRSTLRLLADAHRGDITAELVMAALKLLEARLSLIECAALDGDPTVPDALRALADEAQTMAEDIAGNVGYHNGEQRVPVPLSLGDLPAWEN